MNEPIVLYTPWSRPLPHLLLEITVLAAAVLTYLHARRDRRALFTWWTILVYGVTMEIACYHFVKNFTHAQFSVMFYDRQLPLYVTAVYPVLLYTGIATARRFRLPWLLQGLLAGLLIVALDQPFDVLGPQLGWWTWSDTDPNIAVRWQGVPVTSYFWHFAFGGALAVLTAKMPARWRYVPVAALSTIVAGVLLFMPMHGLAALGVGHDHFVAGALALAALVTLPRLRPSEAPRDLLLVAIPLLFYGLHAGLAAAAPPAERAAVFTVIAAAALVHLFAHRRLARLAPAV